MTSLLYGCTTHTATKCLEKKALLELHKYNECCFEQILEAAPHKTASVRQLISHLTDHPSKANKTSLVLLEKKGWTHKQGYSVDSHKWTPGLATQQRLR